MASFFRSIGQGVKGITKEIRHGAESIYSHVLKPVSKPIGKVFNEVVDKASSLEKTVEVLGDHVLKSTEKIVDGVGRTAENLSQPVFQYIAIGIGLLFAYKLLIEDKK